jgi:anthranilate phosphoribosyltransferase
MEKNIILDRDSSTQHTGQLDQPAPKAFVAARFIKEIGRGKDGARSLSRDDAHLLYAAMLDGRVSDLEMGGILLAMRIKGESVEEIAGFMEAAQSTITSLNAPQDSEFAPVIIPSYNGARKKANLTPLLVLLLARHGVPVLIHGVEHDAGRVTSAEIFSAMNHAFAHSSSEAEQCLMEKNWAFMRIDDLSPKMARLLAMRKILGVRNSTHTLVKILQPFQGAALRLSSYTHPEYLQMLRQYLSQMVPTERGDTFLMRGTEGEAVASTARAQQIDWFHHGQCNTLVETHSRIQGALPETPDSIDAKSTAEWIQKVLTGVVAIPANIAEQVEHCIQVARDIQQR